MLNVHEIITAEVTTLLTGTSEAQATAVKGCESATVLKATRALISVGEIGDGARSGKDLWIGKKANKAIDRKIKQLDALYDEDEVLTAVTADLENGGEGLLLPDGFDAPAEWSDEDAKGKGEDPVETVKRETLAELRARYAAAVKADEINAEECAQRDGDEDYEVKPMTVTRAWVESLIADEEAHEQGARAGVIKMLNSKIKAMDKADERAEAKAEKAAEREAAAKAKAEAKAEAKAKKAAERAEAKAKREAEKAANSQFAGLYILPEIGEDDIDLEADRECPRCGETKNVGEGFGVRRMRRIIYHDTGCTIAAGEADDGDDLAQYAGHTIYIKAVETRVRNQSQCKKCRGKKPASADSGSDDGAGE